MLGGEGVGAVVRRVVNHNLDSRSLAWGSGGRKGEKMAPRHTSWGRRAASTMSELQPGFYTSRTSNSSSMELMRGRMTACIYISVVGIIVGPHSQTGA